MFLRCFAALALLTARPLAAQIADAPAVTPVLSLQDALSLARRNNPAYQQVLSDRRPANAAVRSAYGALLPGADASLSSRYQEGGEQLFNGATLRASSDVLQSSYSIGLSYSLNSATLITPRYAAANRDAVEAEITGAEAALQARVTQQYLSVLQAQENAQLQDTLVAAAGAQLQLAQARASVGAATQLDVRRAEVALGQQRVTALRAHNQVEIEKLRLFQDLGVPQPPNVQLTSTFPIVAPELSLEQVLQLAQQRNPGLLAVKSRERAANVNVRRAQGQYSPTLSLGTSWGGYTRQYTDAEFPIEQARANAVSSRAGCLSQDSLRVGAGLPSIMATCQGIDFTADQAAFIRAENSRYPFDFTRAPWSFSAMLSFPIFDGFAREQRVQEAAAARTDARHAVRARELALTADVTAAFLTLTTAARTVELQQDNSAKARDELALAEERYRVGASTFLDVTEARASFERAESERINAIYDYHKAFAALENAVGRPLR